MVLDRISHSGVAAVKIAEEPLEKRQAEPLAGWEYYGKIESLQQLPKFSGIIHVLVLAWPQVWHVSMHVSHVCCTSKLFLSLGT